MDTAGIYSESSREAQAMFMQMAANPHSGRDYRDSILSVDVEKYIGNAPNYWKYTGYVYRDAYEGKMSGFEPNTSARPRTTMREILNWARM